MISISSTEEDMNIHIVEKRTGKLVADIAINLHGLNYETSEKDYFSEAWQCAVDDKIVDSSRKEEYAFSIASST